MWTILYSRHYSWLFLLLKNLLGQSGLGVFNYAIKTFLKKVTIVGELYENMLRFESNNRLKMMNT